MFDAGIIDDIYGASFVSGAVSGDPMDQNGHGTFVAGVVGAVGNNAIGVTGMNQVISIIACQFMDATGNGWVSDAIQCIDYCISKDAHILQNSWGGVDYSDALQVSPKSRSTAQTSTHNPPPLPPPWSRLRPLPLGSQCVTAPAKLMHSCGTAQSCSKPKLDSHWITL